MVKKKKKGNIVYLAGYLNEKIPNIISTKIEQKAEKFVPTFIEFLRINGIPKIITIPTASATAGTDTAYYTVPVGSVLYITSIQGVTSGTGPNIQNTLIFGPVPLVEIKRLMVMVCDGNESHVSINPIIPIEVSENNLIGVSYGGVGSFFGAIINGFLIDKNLITQK